VWWEYLQAGGVNGLFKQSWRPLGTEDRQFGKKELNSQQDRLHWTSNAKN